MRCVMLMVALLAVGLILPRSAADDGEEAEEDTSLDVETILANPLDADEYRDTRHCISTRGYDAIEVLNETTLLFHGRGDVWLNRLSGRCRGLTWDMIPTFASHGSRVCQHDRFRGQSRSGSLESMSCTLGRFEKIDEGQVESLRAAHGGHPDSGS